MLLTADWVMPIDAPPIRDGAVVIRHNRISEVGPAPRFAGSAEHRYDFPGCMLLPGLVNTHTHLSLTALEGLIPPAPFPEWLRRVVPMMQALDDDDMAASASLGALRSLQAGVTTVGDICYGPEALAAAADLGVTGVFFWEVLGVPSSQLRSTLEAAEFPLEELVGRTGAPRATAGVSPHSPYTSGPLLLSAAARFAREHHVPLAVHVAESQAEVELLEHGDGDLAGVAGRLAHEFRTPHASPVSYLAGLGVLDGALAVHCVHLDPGDAHVLARRTRGVALCPRSNAYLHNGHPPVERLVQAKATLGIGTDSVASNRDLDLLAEARALRDLAPGALSASRLLRMLTLEGATALGLEKQVGSLTPGKAADILVMKVDATDTPAEVLIERGGMDNVRAVISSGAWRIRDGQPTQLLAPYLRAADRATDKARLACDAG